MATVADLVQDTRRRMSGMHRSEFNQLQSNITDTQTQFNVIYAIGGIGAGSYIAIGDELIYVLGAVGSTKQLTVLRGQLGTSQTTHNANDQIEVNPRFPPFEIRATLTREIDSWPSSLYRTASATLTMGADDRTVDMTGLTPFRRVLEVLHQPRTGADYWITMPSWRVQRNMDTTDYASGAALFLPNFVGVSSGRSLRVTVAQAFDTSDMSDAVDTDDIGLTAEMLDIPTYGAAWRMLSTREIKRTFTEAQGEPRFAEEVPPGHMSQTALSLKTIRDQRIAEEARRLYEAYRPLQRA